MADTIGIIKNAKDRADLSSLLEQFRIAKDTAKGLEEEMTELKEAIIPLFEKHDLKSLEFAGRVFVRQSGCSTNINKIDLLGRGVDPEIIADCTRRTEYVSLQLRSIKG